MLRVLATRLRHYMANADPKAEAAVKIALLIAFNQPFYPIYLYLAVGSVSSPAWFTLLTTPFFVAIPAVARRHSLNGRAMLAVVGIASTVLGVKLLGAATYAQLFLIPCVVLGALLFRRGERAIMALVFWAVFLAYLSIDGGLGAAIAALTPEDQAAIATINAVSVTCLTVCIGIFFSPIRRKPKNTRQT